MDLFSSILDYLEGDAPPTRSRIYLDILYYIQGGFEMNSTEKRVLAKTDWDLEMRYLRTGRRGGAQPHCNEV